MQLTRRLAREVKHFHLMLRSLFPIIISGAKIALVGNDKDSFQLNSSITMIDNEMSQLNLSSKSKNDELSLPLKDIIVDDDFESDRLLMIKGVLEGFPSEIAGIVGDYDHHDKSLDDLNERILNELSIQLGDRARKFRFYSKEFIDNLLKALNHIDKSKIESLSHFFWYDLARILFKWIIYAKEKLVITKNRVNLERESRKSIESIAFIIQKYGKLIFPLEFNLTLSPPSPSSFLDSSMRSKDESGNEKRNEFSTFSFINMMNCEIIEHSQTVFNSFASLVNDFYNKKIKLLSILKEKYFHGNFNRNLRLKFMIILHDPWGEMRRALFSENEYSNLLIPKVPFISIPSPLSFPSFIRDLETRGPNNLVIADMHFSNDSIIEFFIENDKRFRIFMTFDLIILLEKLKTSISWKIMKKSLDQIIEFSGINGGRPSSWNRKLFKTYLKDGLLNEIITQDQYDEYMKWADQVTLDETD